MRAAAAAALALAGCVGAPAVPELLEPRERALAELQVRRYPDARPHETLLAAVSALQDLGFQVTSSDEALGLVVAQRGYRRDFAEASREFWQGYLQAMSNVFTFQWNSPGRDPRRLAGPAGFNAAVTVAPAASGSSVRVSLHRYVARPGGEQNLVWAEELREPEPYARFFAALAQSLATSSRSP